MRMMGPKTLLLMPFMILIPSNRQFMMKVVFHLLSRLYKVTMELFLLMVRQAVVRLILCLEFQMTLNLEELYQIVLLIFSGSLMRKAQVLSFLSDAAI